MGRLYIEPTLYRDKQCPNCDLYFSARGLNGHIRFKHGGYERNEIVKLKQRLFKRVTYLPYSKKYYPESVNSFIGGRLGSLSDATLDELRQIEDGIDEIYSSILYEYQQIISRYSAQLSTKVEN